MTTKYITRRYRVSRTFNAPRDFVYRWCTDFREDDWKYTGSSARRTFLEKSKRRYVWVVNYRERGKKKEGIRAVWFKPPNAWHLDTCGDVREVGEYKVTPQGKKKTRLDMTFDVTYDDPKDVESKQEWEAETRKTWKTYATALEREYNALRK